MIFTNCYKQRRNSLNNILFKINRSLGLDSIPAKILHLVQDQTSQHLASICALSFPTVIFPTISKTAKVISIHKKNPKLEVPNYRVISLLLNIDKIFEPLIHLLNFLRKNKFSIANSLIFEKISQQIMSFQIF